MRFFSLLYLSKVKEPRYFFTNILFWTLDIAKFDSSEIKLDFFIVHKTSVTVMLLITVFKRVLHFEHREEFVFTLPFNNIFYFQWEALHSCYLN